MLESITPGKIRLEELHPSSKIILTADEKGRLNIKVDSDTSRVESLIDIAYGIRDPNFFKGVIDNICDVFEKESPETIVHFSTSVLEKLSKVRPIVSPIKLGMKYDNSTQ